MPWACPSNVLKDYSQADILGADYSEVDVLGPRYKSVNFWHLFDEDMADAVDVAQHRNLRLRRLLIS